MCTHCEFHAAIHSRLLNYSLPINLRDSRKDARIWAAEIKLKERLQHWTLSRMKKTDNIDQNGTTRYNSVVKTHLQRIVSGVLGPKFRNCSSSSVSSYGVLRALSTYIIIELPGVLQFRNRTVFHRAEY